MDDIDEKIIGLLEVDGRLAFGDIARTINLSRPAVAERTRRLIANGQLNIRGAVHPAVLGQSYLGYAALEITGPARPIAAAIAEHRDVPFVSVTTGPTPVVAEIRATSADTYLECVDWIRSVDGVRSATTLAYLSIVRDVVGPVGEVTTTVDRTDRTLLRHLQSDGRVSYVNLAAEVGLSPAGARRRVMALIDSNVLRIGAVVRHSGHGPHVAMGAAVRLNGPRDHVENELCGLASVIFVARTIGNADFLITIRGFSIAQLSHTTDEIRAIPGVQNVTAWAHLEIVKEAYSAQLID
ncbi:DNA-binding Lrp family transcriptional regulator [Mycobacterium frederiksbergense]|uniref:DNA-binding Lrp family transcriptional regulator n=1 Tax=Mycolicibacterium frederiksbergense TaxID=117567 RepID=A0ABT6KTB8_9MYCO|nr:Lrp/AsnC family transcriptional regulator [Mycolicibacterium frederiksbergense]MDH6193972.1 DNA-binding Lrp family transcriptional regulator [Mycolicibacterium frederiksbergense]